MLHLSFSGVYQVLLDQDGRPEQFDVGWFCKRPSLADWFSSPAPFFCDEHVHPDRNKLIAMSLETGIVLEHIKELDEKTNNFPEGSMGTHKLGKLGVHLQFSFETISFNFFSVIVH